MREAKDQWLQYNVEKDVKENDIKCTLIYIKTFTKWSY